MPFLRAGFNARHRRTGIRGWTRPANGGKFDPAELIVFACGDYAWHVTRKNGTEALAWGEQAVIGTLLELPEDWRDDYERSKVPDQPRRAPPAIKLVLPYPVSANRYWRSFAYVERGTNRPRSVTVPSDEAKAYKEEVGWRTKAAGVRRPIEGPVELRIRLVPESGVCMDLDNCLKVSIDALKGIAFEDDSQVYRITAERSLADPQGGRRLEVEILPYALPMALERAA